MQTLSLPALLLLHLLVYGVLLLWLAPGAGVWALVLLGPLVWSSVVDLRRLEIPDTASALLTLGGFGWLMSLGLVPLLWHLGNATLWCAVFWSASLLYERSRGQVGLGFGDVKLIFGIGLWCGFDGTVLVVLGAALSGILVLLVKSVPSGLRAMSQEPLAFGPYLCLFAWGVWLSKVGQ